MYNILEDKYLYFKQTVKNLSPAVLVVAMATNMAAHTNRL